MKTISDDVMSHINGGDLIGAFCAGFATGAIFFPGVILNPVGATIGVGCTVYSIYRIVAD